MIVNVLGEKMTMEEVDVLLQGLEDASGKVHYEGTNDVEFHFVWQPKIRDVSNNIYSRPSFQIISSSRLVLQKRRFK